MVVEMVKLSFRKVFDINQPIAGDMAAGNKFRSE